MTSLPIVERELRVAARSWRTYYTRVLGAAVAMLATVWLYFAVGAMTRGPAPGLTVFLALSNFACLATLIAGVNATADALSRERREGTLGLLFLSTLNAWDIVSGKLVAGATRGVAVLLAVVPVTSLALILGGVGSAHFWRAVLVLLNTLFFATALGLFTSSLTRDARHAASLASLAAVFFWFLPGIAEGARQLQVPGVPLLAFCTPMHSQMLAGAAVGTSLRDFWISIAVTHGLAWAWLGMACLIVPRTWQDRPAGVTRLRWRDRGRQWSYGSPEVRRRRRARLLEVNPFFWLSARTRWRPAWLWLLVLGLILGWLAIRRSLAAPDTVLSVNLTLLLLLHATVKLALAGEASFRFAQERHQGTLAWIVGTGLPVAELLRGQWLAVRRLMLGPLGVVVLMDLVLLGDLARLRHDLASANHAALAVGAGLLMLLADVPALYWMGMYGGLRARQVRQATSDATTTVLVLPWVLFVLPQPAFAVLGINLGFGGGLCLWLGLGLAVDVFAVRFARRRLAERFQALALPDYWTRDENSFIRAARWLARWLRRRTARAHTPATHAGSRPGAPRP